MRKIAAQPAPPSVGLEVYSTVQLPSSFCTQVGSSPSRRTSQAAGRSSDAVTTARADAGATPVRSMRKPRTTSAPRMRTC